MENAATQGRKLGTIRYIDANQCPTLTHAVAGYTIARIHEAGSNDPINISVP